MSFTIKDITVSDQLAEMARSSLNNKSFFYRFNATLETIYTRYMLSRYQLENRSYPLLGALGLVAFLFADNLVIPELFTEMLLIRGLGAAVILGFIGLTYYYPLYRWYQLFLCLGGLIIHLSLVAIGVLAANHGEYHYQFGSIITIFFISNVMRVGFLYALPFTIAMFLSQVLAITLLTDAPSAQLTEIFFIYTFVTCISLMVNGRMEHEVRKNFLRQILLKYEQTQLVNTQNELQKLSISDSLTGLYNRRYFNKHLDREWLSAARQKTPLAVLMIDVDDFKHYNDTQGHLAGDDALSKIGGVLGQCIKRPDDLVARYGGEEFVATLPYTDETASLSVATEMLTKVLELNINHPMSSHKKVSISIGCCSIIPDQELSIKDLLKCADDALYESKRKGKNCVSIGRCNSSHQ